MSNVDKITDAFLQNGALAKFTAMFVIVLSTLGLIVNMQAAHINQEIVYIMTSIISFACGYLFSKRDKKE